MFNKITSFEITKDNVEILDNEFVKTASEIILPEGHAYDPDFTYMKVRAVSAGEYWGNNKNADYFPEAELIKNYKTFFDAHVFKNHENKDVEKAIGDVLDATWNDEMKYVELLIRVDKRIAPTIARGFEKGFMTDVSMGCKIDHSICSICGNVAKTQSQYCDHIKFERHKVYDDGRKVFEININPRFHDISAVLNGADRTAKMTGLYISGTKVAYFEDENLEKTASFEGELCKEAELREEFKAMEKALRKKRKEREEKKEMAGKSKEKPRKMSDSEYYMAGHGGAGVKITKKASFEDAFSSDFDNTPLFEKVASTRKTAKELEVEKLAEIKKRIKGRILGVAKQRLEDDREMAFSEGMEQYESNFMSPISDSLIDRVAEKLSYLSDRENIPVEIVVSKLLKVLIMAGVRLAPLEFSRLMRGTLSMEGNGGAECFDMPPRTVVRIRRRTMDDALGARTISGMNVPTVIRVIKRTSTLPSMTEMLPTSMGSGSAGRVIMMKLASSGQYELPDEIHGGTEGRVERELVKIASELMDERSLHTHCILKRAEAMGEEMEKVAGCDDYVAQYDYFRGENCTVAEEFDKIAYTTYMNMAKEYVESRELQSDLFKYAEELGLNDTGLDKIAKWKPIKTLPIGVGTYLAAKYQGVKAREGRPQSTLERTMAENPQASAVGAYLAANMGIHGYGKAKKAINEGAKAMSGKLSELKDKTKIIKKASENVDNYLNLRFEDELFDNIHDEIQDVDIFKDKVVDDKLASFYDDNQIGMLKLASLVYAQERQDVCDNVLAKAGLKYEDMGIFLEACEETLYEELEKKAGIVGTLAKGLGGLGAKAGAKLGATTAGATIVNKAKPIVNSVMDKAAPAMGAVKDAVQPVVNKVQPAVQNIMAKPGAQTAMKTVGAGVGTGIGAGVANKVMNNNKQPQNNTIVLPPQ